MRLYLHARTYDTLLELIIPKNPQFPFSGTPASASMRRLITMPLYQRFYPGLPHESYENGWPNRVWSLLHNRQHRYQTKYSTATDRSGSPVDYLHPSAYALNVRTAIFVIYSEWPEDGQKRLDLLHSVVGPDISQWERTTPIHQIIQLLYSLDI